MEILNPTSCINCNTALQGDFCHACGQHVRKERLTMKFLISDFFSNVFALEKGSLFTAKELLIRPGKVVSDFLKGKTIIYTNPFKFLFITATLGAAFIAFLDFNEIGRGMIGSPKETNAFAESINNQVFDLLKNYSAFLIILFAPLYALSSKLVYKKSNYFFSEHLIIASYITGITAIYSLISTLIVVIFSSLQQYYALLGLPMYIYVIYAYVDTFSTKGFKGFGLAILNILLFFVIYLFLIMLAGFIWAMTQNM